ncbi:hypothetical protein Cni_G03016 [Canna indica]|uniref:Uncharacterized protein n=1 Tax=Canna indica TaxID=4628 RepID=A0AAQ3Q2Y9_9LILI|nr:hypothetical protein Cni_G03016 [Canna indica]
MARGAVEWGRGGVKCCCSFRRITVVVCCVNLIAALLVLRSFYTSFFDVSSSRLTGVSLADQAKKMEDSIRIRRAAEPLALVKAVKKLRKELSREEKRALKLPELVKQKLANEVLQRLQGVNNSNLTEQQDAVSLWRVEKLEEVKKAISSKSNSNSSSSIPYQEAKMLKRILETNWPKLIEGIGLWMPANVINTEHDDKPENEPEIEEIIPGRPMPPECHAELHTDYDGAAVRWGLTHHKESAADCCQACLDQAKRAKPGEMKCNIWVYCPSEFGCYSPDIYEHKHQECWLKQAEKPRLNFKEKYSESYRNNHPTAPVVVPWMSGFVGA